MAVKFTVRRFNPAIEHEPRYQDYEVDLPEGATVLDALYLIKERQDDSLAFRSSCRSSICGSCAMLINGQSKLACKTPAAQLAALDGRVLVEPMRVMPVMKDLIVDMQPFWSRVEAVHPWLMPSPEEPEREHIVPKEQMDLIRESVNCIMCGVCVSECPALAVGQDFLGPAALVKAHRFVDDPRDAAAGKRFRENLAPESALWPCTTCRACTQVCPVDINHIPKILQMRTYQVQEESRFPKEMRPVFANLEVRGNPWMMPAPARADWAQGLGIKTMAQDREVEFLYFVGCFGAFDERNKKVSVALAKTLQASGISFAILGPEERCTGDPAKRSGNDYLFQMLAEKNLETFHRYGVRKIITQCPHCYNTFKNDYPALGGSFEVIHHTQLLADLLAQGKLRPSRNLGLTLTYHDPCYLGRHHQIYDAPRQILQALPGLRLVDMPLSRQKSFCCGGGGGRAFLEERFGARINHERVQQAASIGAGVIGAACPFCVTMFEDGLKGQGLEEAMKVKDCVELLAEAL